MYGVGLKLRNRAFTIVELLVVIVVIGVLAAVTIISYSGISARAYNAKAVSIVDSYQKIFEMYYLENEHYPGDDSGSSMICLGKISDYPATEDFDEGECITHQTGSGTYASGIFDAEVSEFLKGSSISGLLPVTQLGTDKFRGVFYTISAGQIMYAMNGSADCARGAKFYSSQDNFTGCTIQLANETNAVDPPTCEELGNCE